jgi:Putative binding domain, N-terminal
MAIATWTGKRAKWLWMLAVLVLIIGATTSTVFTQSSIVCTVFNFKPATASFTAAGGSGSVTCDKGSQTFGLCGWVANSNASWITIVSGASSDTSGLGTLQYQVAANTGPARSGTITFSSGQYGSALYTISQAGASGGVTVSPGRLDFTYVLNAQFPPSQVITVSGGAPGATYFTSTTENTTNFPLWLFGVPTSLILNSTGSGSITVSVVPRNLPAGSYTGQVAIQDGNGNAVATIPVTLNVQSTSTNTAPPIQVPKISNFSLRVDNPGALPSPQTLPVTSLNGNISFGVTTSTSTARNWLRVDKTAGVTPTTVTVSVDPSVTSTLPQGSYLGLVTFHPAGNSISAAKSPLAGGNPSDSNAAIVLTIGPLAPLIATPDTLGLDSKNMDSDVNVKAASATSSITVTASTVSIDGPDNLLTLTPPNGSTPKIFTVAINNANPQLRPYFGLLTLVDSTTGAGKIVPVNVNAAPNGVASDPDSLTFSGEVGGAPPAPQTITLTSPSTGVGGTVVSDSPWLSVSPTNFTTPAILSVTTQPGGLTADKYAGQLKVTSGSATFGIPVALNLQNPSSTAPSRQVISQIATGPSWKTTIMLVNADSVAAKFSLNFWGQDGSPVQMPLDDGSNGTTYNGTIPLGGMKVIATAGASLKSTIQGWVEVVSQQQIGGLAIFRQRVDGRPEFEAASPLSATAGGDFLLPFDNTDHVTTMALVNPASVRTTVKVRIRSDQLASPADYTVDMLPHTQQAFALAEKFAAVAGNIGVAEFSSTESPLAGLGLRFAGEAFTSVPVLTATDRVLPGRRWLAAQVADGGGWKTGITVLNGDSAASGPLLNFYRQDGQPLSLPLTVLPATQGGNPGSISGLQANIAASSSTAYATTDAANTTSQGWLSMAGGRALGGFATFRQHVAGRSDFEAATPMVRYPVGTFIVPFDNTLNNNTGEDFDTGMALVNPSQTSATVSVTIRDENGKVVGSGTEQLPPLGQTTFPINGRYGSPLRMRGVAEFSCPTGVSGLALRFNYTRVGNINGGAFTSLPIIPR